MTRNRKWAAALLAVWTIPALAYGMTIVSPEGASALEQQAAAEVRRYVYLRTGEVLTVAPELGADGGIVVAEKGNAYLKRVSKEAAWEGLGPQDYALKTAAEGPGRTVFLVGGSGPSTLYAAYRFAECLGVRFYLHGDVIPDRRIPLELPALDETASPLFGLRGIQPFHDFPEGPDWWNVDDYLAIINQLPKLRMNFIGLHTYPVVEPAVWIGVPEDVGPNGRAKFGYPARWFNTGLTVGWGFAAKDTSEYACGAANLFHRNEYGSDFVNGLTPEPSTEQEILELWDRVGVGFAKAFGRAKELGVKTCVGTETPLVVPDPVKERMGGNVDVGKLYEGIFTKIMKTHPLDYYWFWTPEGWTWEGVKEEVVQKTVEDILAAKAAAEKVGAPFGLATCGWVLGPQYDRAYLDNILPKDMAMSCINRQVGHDPVEPGFAEVEGREKWAIPWLEDDPAMTSPQLWVGRMRRDARDARKYGCTGLMGIHWRTRVLGPNVLALSQAAWDQTGFPEDGLNETGVLGGNVARFEGAEFADTDDDPLYRDVRYGLQAYRLRVPNGAYKVTLHLCEPHYKEAGKRVFGVKLEGEPVISGLDLFEEAGKNRAVVRAFEGVEVSDGELEIAFVNETEMPCIAAFEVEGPGFSQKVNCGGAAYKDFVADLPPANTHLPAGDFYADWAEHEFGPEAGVEAARILTAMDGKLPRPSDWIGGPGGYAPDPRPWSDVAKDYAFVDEFAALRGRVAGEGNRERFEYWLHTLEYLRATGRMRCVWAEYNRQFERAKAEATSESQAKLAREAALPARIELIRAVEEAYRHQLAATSTAGEMGTLCNLEQHTFPGMLEAPAKELEQLMGAALPAEAFLSREYEGAARLFVPTAPTAAQKDGSLVVKAIFLDKESPKKVTLHWRAGLGAGEFQETTLEKVARGVHRVEVPAEQRAGKDFEYYVEAVTDSGETVRWPASAPAICHTVIAVP